MIKKIKNVKYFNYIVLFKKNIRLWQVKQSRFTIMAI